MKRILIAACVVVGTMAFNAADAQAIAIQFDTTNKGGDVWQYSYSVSDFAFGANQALFIDFDSTLYSDLQESPPAPNADWSTFTLPTSVQTPGTIGDLPPGSFVALSLVDGASLLNPFTVTFTWLGGGGSAPGSQLFTVYDVDSDGNLVPIPNLPPGETTPAGAANPVPEPGTLGLMTIGVALAGRRALRRRRHS